jgi:hypothetical protein
METSILAMGSNGIYGIYLDLLGLNGMSIWYQDVPRKIIEYIDWDLKGYETYCGNITSTICEPVIKWQEGPPSLFWFMTHRNYGYIYIYINI